MIFNYADHSANERTCLAWVRTVIAIEGFGIAAARLGHAPSGPGTELAMLFAGAVVIVLAFIRMRHIRARIEQPDAVDDEAGPADALLLLLVGALFALIATFAVHIS